MIKAQISRSFKRFEKIRTNAVCKNISRPLNSSRSLENLSLSYVLARAEERRFFFYEFLYIHAAKYKNHGRFWLDFYRISRNFVLKSFLWISVFQFLLASSVFIADKFKTIFSFCYFMINVGIVIIIFAILINCFINLSLLSCVNMIELN